MPATIKDIAARLGVSHVTVSRALRGFPYVNEELRQRIVETAREMNYRPNALARRLKGMRTRVVGLIIPDLMNDFYASAAALIQSTLARNGYRILLGVSGNDPSCELDYLRMMREERVEGLVWVPKCWHEDVLAEYRLEGVPVIQFGRMVSDRLDAILPDDERGVELAANHLLDLGHRRIGLLVGSGEMSSGRARRDGYLRALQKAGIPVEQQLIQEGRFDRQWGQEATETLLRLPSPPSAILAASSELLIGALKVLDNQGIRVPVDLSLVGFSNPDWYALWRPPITTVAFSTEEAAATVVSTLLAQSEDPSARVATEPQRLRYSMRLVLRASTSAP